LPGLSSSRSALLTSLLTGLVLPALLLAALTGFVLAALLTTLVLLAALLLLVVLITHGLFLSVERLGTINRRLNPFVPSVI
jgi:hypothetical protein